MFRKELGVIPRARFSRCAGITAVHSRTSTEAAQKPPAKIQRPLTGHFCSDLCHFQDLSVFTGLLAELWPSFKFGLSILAKCG